MLVSDSSQLNKSSWEDDMSMCRFYVWWKNLYM